MTPDGNHCAVTRTALVVALIPILLVGCSEDQKDALPAPVKVARITCTNRELSYNSPRVLRQADGVHFDVRTAAGAQLLVGGHRYKGTIVLPLRPGAIRVRCLQRKSSMTAGFQVVAHPSLG
jgi:hypothetical protein